MIGVLDLDDVGAPLAEHRARRRDEAVHRDLEDADTFQGPHAGVSPPGGRESATISAVYLRRPFWSLCLAARVAPVTIISFSSSANTTFEAGELKKFSGTALTGWPAKRPLSGTGSGPLGAGPVRF